MQGSQVEPTFVGRDLTLDVLNRVAGTRPGAIVVWGAAGVGRTRLVREFLTGLERGLHRVRVPAGPEDVMARLGQALTLLSLPPDPERCARIEPFVATIVGSELDADEILEPAFRGTRSLAVVIADGPSSSAPSIHVQPLDAESAEGLVRSMGAELDDSRVAEIVRLGEGLPRWLVPLARAAEAGSDRVPATIAAWSTAQLADASEAEREAMAWSALAGSGTEADLLSRVLKMPRPQVEDLLDRLIHARHLEPSPTRGERLVLRVRPPALAAAILGEMGPNERRRRHAAIFAAAQEVGWTKAQLLPHAEGAGERAHALELAIGAAEEARSFEDAEAALRLAERALELWRPNDGGRLRSRAYLERGRARWFLKDWPGAVPDLEEAAAGLRLARDERGSLEAAQAAGLADWNRGERQRAYARLAAFLGDSDPEHSDERAEALLTAAMFAGSISKSAASRDFARRARIAGIAQGLPQIASRGLALFGYARSALTGTMACQRYFERARAEALAVGDARTASITSIWASHFLLSLGRMDEALATASGAVDFAHTHGMADHETVFIGNVGEAHAGKGELDAGARNLATAAAEWSRLGSVPPAADATGAGWLLVQQGNFDDALAYYRRLVDPVDPEGMVFHELAAFASGYIVAGVEAGDRERAADIARRTLSVWLETDDRVFILPVLGVAGEALDVSEATICRDHLNLARRDGVALADAFLSLAAGHVARHEDALAAAVHYRAAAAAFDRYGLAWWAARCLLQAGVVAERGEDAERDLFDARVRFGDMNAGAWRQRAEAALRLSGRRIPSRGMDPKMRVGGLSSRETEVLRELMVGGSNQEIGDRLFIAQRTVARHMASLFAKLNVSNRRAAEKMGYELGLTPAGESDDTPVAVG